VFADLGMRESEDAGLVGHGGHDHAANGAVGSVIDPVCGMAVAADEALGLVREFVPHVSSAAKGAL
jgi:hypothetical protein